MSLQWGLKCHHLGFTLVSSSCWKWCGVFYTLIVLPRSPTKVYVLHITTKSKRKKEKNFSSQLHHWLVPAQLLIVCPKPYVTGSPVQKASSLSKKPLKNPRWASLWIMCSLTVAVILPEILGRAANVYKYTKVNVFHFQGTCVKTCVSVITSARFLFLRLLEQTSPTQTFMASSSLCFLMLQIITEPVWNVNFFFFFLTFYMCHSFCSLGRSDCIFRDDGRGLPLGGAGRPDRPPAVAAHLPVHQQCLLLLLLLRAGIQHLPALQTPLRRRVGFSLSSGSLIGSWEFGSDSRVIFKSIAKVELVSVFLFSFFNLH